jgi:hypothetical protein
MHLAGRLFYGQEEFMITKRQVGLTVACMFLGATLVSWFQLKPLEKQENVLPPISRVEQPGRGHAALSAVIVSRQLRQEKAGQLLTNGLACTQFIENLKSRVDHDQDNIQRQLDALNTVLLDDDKRLVGLLAKPEGPKVLTDYYQGRLESANEPGFRKVADVISQLASDSEDSGLLKEAWNYAALRTLAKERSERESRTFAASAKEMVSKPDDHLTSENAAGLGKFYEFAQQAITNEETQTLDVYEKLYAWRFRERYGLDGVVELLADVKLASASPADLHYPTE